MAASLPGVAYNPAPLLFQSLSGEAGHGRCRLVGFGSTAFAPSAAWLNGTSSHAVELDDIYREAITHPGSPTIAAALAIADDRDARGQDMLAAIAAGYEVLGRVGAALQPAHSERFHATGTLGCLGAATAASVLLHPGDATKIANSLATAATFASGLQEAVRSESMTKPIHAGHAAAVGVRAALAADAGVTGAMAILDGPTGFAAALARGGVDWGAALANIGAPFVIEQASHKVHACCGHTFPAIDATLALRKEHAISPEQVHSIEVVTYQAALDATARPSPRTPYEGKFSLPFVVSHALAYGAVGLDAFTPERLGDPTVRELMQGCTTRADAAMSAEFPQSRPAQVNITLNSGKIISHRRSVRRGDPENPLTDRELGDKLLSLVSPLLGSDYAQALLAQIWTLDTIRVRDLDLSRTVPGRITR